MYYSRTVVHGPICTDNLSNFAELLLWVSFTFLFSKAVFAKTLLRSLFFTCWSQALLACANRLEKWHKKRSISSVLRAENRPKLAANRSNSTTLFKKHAKNFSKYKQKTTLYKCLIYFNYFEMATRTERLMCESWKRSWFLPTRSLNFIWTKLFEKIDFTGNLVVVFGQESYFCLHFPVEELLCWVALKHS